MVQAHSRAGALLARCVVIAALGVAVAGCSMRAGGGRGDVTGSIAPRQSEAQWRSELDGLAARYRSAPEDKANAMRYARGLRATGQSAQAVAVLERVAIRSPNDMTLLGEYGRALADVGRHDQALEVLSRAHKPDQPDWRVINAQGSVYDQMGRHDEAQRLYGDALRIAPGHPQVLTNLGLSLALTRNLPQAEAALRQAAANPQSDARTRQNLALVIGLQGRFDEAEQMARKDLPPDQAAATIATLRGMLSQPNAWSQIRRNERGAGARSAAPPERRG